jgi:NADH dehydrogenase/NADH:ubiquinone oxidoreductase subunit G
MFLTETAQRADVVLPAASAYEKNGTVTNVCGEVQRLKRAINTMGAKPDLEIMGLIAREMGVAADGPLAARYRFRTRFARTCAVRCPACRCWPPAARRRPRR